MTVARPANVGYNHRQGRPLKPRLRTMRDLRIEQGLDLRGLERETGINRATLSQIERGRLSPTARETRLISAALGADLELRLQLVHEEASR
jgi:transcriptional regulator with XRE-family HTH domain